MKTKIMMLLVVFFFALSCNKKDTTEADNETLNDSPEVVINDEHNAKNSLDYMGYYSGILPCADCEGIQTELILEEKGYVLKTMYLNVGNDKFFQHEGTYSWNEAGNTIILEGIDNGPSQYFVGENYLIQLDLEGNKITGDLADKYILNKTVSPPPPAPDSIKGNFIPKKTLFIFNKWKLVELNGKPVNNNSNKEMFIQLNKENRYTAFAGCNNMMGSFELKEDVMRVKFTKGASTMMACPDMTTEQEFAEMLEKVDNYSLKGNNLSFNRARMAPLARFEAIK